MHATIFGNVVSIVGRMYGRRAEYDKKVETQYIESTQHDPLQVLDLEYFARLHKLPKDVRQRLVSWSSMSLSRKISSEYTKPEFSKHSSHASYCLLLPSSIITQDGWPPSDKVVLQSRPGQQGGVGEGWWQILDPGGVSGRPPGRDILPPLQGTTWSTTFWLSLLQLQVHLQDGQKIK